MTSFAPVPDVPLEGLNLAESSLFKALKEDVEILTGARTPGVRAVMTDTVSNGMQATDNISSPRVTAIKQGFTYSSFNSSIVIIDSAQFFALVDDVQNTKNDLVKVQNALNSLIGLLRS